MAISYYFGLVLQKEVRHSGSELDSIVYPGFVSITRKRQDRRSIQNPAVILHKKKKKTNGNS